MLTYESIPAAQTSGTRILRHIRDLEEIADPWDEMADRAGCPAASAAWATASARAFGQDGRLRVVTVSRHGRLAAVAPLVSTGTMAAPWRLIGLRQMAEPADFLAAHPSALKDLARELARLAAPLHLGRLPAGSQTIDALRAALQGRGFLTVRQAPPWPRIALDAGWQEPEARLGAERRQDLRRARRRAMDLGGISFDCHAARPSDVEPLLDEAYRVEAAGWKGRSGTALAGDLPRGEFIRLLALSAARRGWLRIGLLRLGEATAAMQIGLQMGGAHWVLKIGYDERYRRVSPGTLLMMEMIRHAARAGLASYEFLGTAEAWLRPWTSEIRSCISVRAYPARFGGLLVMGFDGARSTWHRARMAVRPR